MIDDPEDNIQYISRRLTLARKRRKELDDLISQIRSELAEATAAQFGISVGSIVLRRNVEYMVSSISPMDTNGAKPWVRGKRRNKDGSWSRAVRQLYDEWELA